MTQAQSGSEQQAPTPDAEAEATAGQQQQQSTAGAGEATAEQQQQQSTAGAAELAAGEKAAPTQQKSVEIDQSTRLPNYRRHISARDVRGGYRTVFGTVVTSFFLLVAAAVVATSAPTVSISDVAELLASLREEVNVVLTVAGLALIALIWWSRRESDVYLVDFALFHGEEDLKITHEKFMRISTNSGLFSQESLDFQNKILSKSAVGGECYFPPALVTEPVDTNMKMARLEAEMVMFSCVKDVLEKTAVSPRQIDFLVVNCSLFCPTPSLASMIVNHFKMKSTIKSFNLGGMGCSAGVISIDLAKDMLKLYPNSRALVVSTENITLNWYKGAEKSMLLANTLFRAGGAAMLLSNRPGDKRRAKLKLLHVVRTHKGAENDCYQSVFQEEDPEGKVGVRLSKKIMEVAGIALKSNITTLGPMTLPLSEQVKYFLNLSARTLIKRKLPKGVPGPVQHMLYSGADAFLWLPKLEQQSPHARLVRSLRRLCSLPVDVETDKDGDAHKGSPYIPDFTKGIDHFCVHAGGRRVLDAVEMNLRLPEGKLEASRHTLFRYGNTSSSSIWYEMQYHLANSNVRAGDKLWQIAFGSGFKCNSAVWQSLRTTEHQSE